MSTDWRCFNTTPDGPQHTTLISQQRHKTPDYCQANVNLIQRQFPVTHAGIDACLATPTSPPGPTFPLQEQKGLGQSQRRCQQRIQEREKELQELRKAVETLKSSAQTAVEESERMFTEMMRSIERRRSEVTELIRAQEKAEVSRAEGLLKRLEQEIAELKRRDAEMKQLSLTEDHIHFLKNIVSISDDARSTVWTRRTFSQSFSFEPVKESVSALKMQLEEKLDSIFKQEIVKISAAGWSSLELTQTPSTSSFKTYTDPELPVRRAGSKELLPPVSKSFQRASNSLHSL
ncbi:hypothetical protein ACEWY4_012498 [Coilia grayii]|uniref:TRIM8/14/16/25/29/45/65 coiled-coil region domain-containing protein n=1 Tax=Coilia grayii TaxID=363190 RepID=A0ABD1K0S6_9TELE